MKSILATILVATLVALVAAEVSPYADQQVITFHVTSDSDLNQVRAFVVSNNLDVWGENSKTGSIDVRMTRQLAGRVRHLLPNIQTTVMIRDLDAAVTEHLLANSQAASKIHTDANGLVDDSWFTAYHTAPEILKFLDDIAKAYPSITSLEHIGNTLQGEKIMGIKLGSRKQTNKRIVVYNSLQHAREWISGAVTTYIINKMATGYGSDPQITLLLDELDWFIVPIVNVDGYKFSWASNRMWRKNRRPGNTCYGVDTNRNWANHFVSNPPIYECTETYSGATPFSEPEPKALADWIAAHPKTVAYIDWHAYSQLVMWPWAWTSAAPPNQAVLAKVGNDMATALYSVNGLYYEPGQIYTTIYPAYGSSVDWTLGNSNVTLSYTIELRDTGRYGFLLPPEQILPSGKESWAAVVAMGNYIIRNPV